MTGKKDNGSTTLFYVLMIFLFFLIFAIGYEGLRMVAVVNQIDHAVDLSVRGVAEENWENVYQGIREGYAGTYTKKDLAADWEQVMNKDQILDQLSHMIDFKKENGEWVKKDSQGRVLFSLKPEKTTVTIINTNLGADEGAALLVETTNTFTIPWIFLGSFFDAPPIQFERKTVSGYTPRF